jgi:hypothetical protein
MRNALHIKQTLLLLLLLAPLWVLAQNGNGGRNNRPSPPATASGKIGTTLVTIDYSSPAVKNRTVWGELVPYGKVWRAGANEATTIEFSQDVQVEGRHLAKGKYSIYTIPNENQWTVIFNKATGQWGTEYDERQDALRVNVKPRTMGSMQERLSYHVVRNGILLRWDKLEIPVKIK